MFVSGLDFSALLPLMSPWQNGTEVKEWPLKSNMLLSQAPPLTFCETLVK